MNAYLYMDNDNNWEPVFLAIAAIVSDADKMFKETIGFDVTKKPNIGCSIEFNVNTVDYEY